MKLLLLHGFTGRGAAWDGVIDALSGHWRCEAPDLPGHDGRVQGTLPPDFDATIDLFAERYLDRDRDGERHLVGYSLGGRLALGLALRHPAAFSSVTLIGVRPGLDAVDRPPRLELDRRRAREICDDTEGFLKRWSQLPLFASQRRLPPAVLEGQRRLRRSHDPEGLAWAVETLSPAAMPDFRPRLGDLQMPVHWLTGELDTPFRRLAEGLDPGPRLCVKTIPGSGHNVPLEAPKALARYLEVHLEPRAGVAGTAEAVSSGAMP